MEYKVNVIDIETFGKDEIKPYCCSIVYKNKIFNTYGIGCVQIMLDWIFKNCINRTIFFAHNLTFDGGIIINSISDKYQIKNEGTCLKNSNIYSISIQKNNIEIIFRCSAKLLPLELGVIAKKLKLPEKLDFDHDAVNDELISNVEFKIKAKKYCERDVMITQRFIIKFYISIQKLLPN